MSPKHTPHRAIWVTQLEIAKTLGITRSAIANALASGWLADAGRRKTMVNLWDAAFIAWARKNPYPRAADGSVDGTQIPKRALDGVWRDDPTRGVPIFDLSHPRAAIYYARCRSEDLLKKILELRKALFDGDDARIREAWVDAYEEESITDEFEPRDDLRPRPKPTSTRWTADPSSLPTSRKLMTQETNPKPAPSSRPVCRPVGASEILRCRDPESTDPHRCFHPEETEDADGHPTA